MFLTSQTVKGGFRFNLLTLIWNVYSRPENKSKGYTVIVDTRGTFGKAVKPFARFFAAVPDQSFTTKQIVFVKSDDFIEKQIANLRIRTKKNREVPVSVSKGSIFKCGPLKHVNNYLKILSTPPG